MQQRRIVQLCKQCKRNFYEAPIPKVELFNKKILLQHKNASAMHCKDASTFDYIRDEIAENMIERLQYISKQFPIACELGAGKGHFVRKLPEKSLNGMQTLYACDSSQLLLDLIPNEKPGLQIVKRLVDEEEHIPFEQRSLDLVLCANYLHWINKLPETLANIQKVLKPDGVFIGGMLGGETLSELRTSLVLAEQEREGGVSPHISPFVGIRDAGNLLTRAGFTIPTVDSEVLTVYYPDAFTLMYHLQRMGENNALFQRRMQISRQTLLAAASIYEELFGTEQGIPATFEMIYMIGWSPDASQKQAAKRGTAEISMKSLAKQTGGEYSSIDGDKQ